MIDPDGNNARRLTDNHAADAFATLSADGKTIVFDSNRLRDEDEPLNTSDLFVMNTDGTEQQHLTRGGSPTWSPDSKRIAFHASSSGTALPIQNTPGAATADSDIFVANVDDLLDGSEAPRNVTNNPDFVDDDPDWSPDGHTVVLTRHDAFELDHNSPLTVEIYRLDVDVTSAPQRLTFNNYEERAADVSPDGTRIVFMCRLPDTDFELCVMNADGAGLTALTNNTVGDLGFHWSTDGKQIVFQRPVGGGRNQLFVINARWQRHDPDHRAAKRRTAGMERVRILGPAEGQSRQVAAVVKRLIALAGVALTFACSSVDGVEDDDLSPVCQPPHGETGHDHREHVAGLPTCP